MQRNQVQVLLQERISDCLQQIAEQLLVQGRGFDATLMPSVHGCINDALALARWCESDNSVDKQQAMKCLKQLLCSSNTEISPETLRVLFSLQLRLNNAPRIKLESLLQERVQQAFASVMELKDGAGQVAMQLLFPLASLLQFIQVGESARICAVAETPYKMQDTGNCVLPGLLRWHLQYEESGFAASNKQIPVIDLHVHIQQGLSTLADQCSNSEWNLNYHVPSGMLRRCSELVQLGYFCEQQSMQKSLQQLQQVLLVLHARSQVPDEETLLKILRQLMQLSLGKYDAGFEVVLPDLGMQPSLDETASVLAQAELARYGKILAEALSDTRPESVPPRKSAHEEMVLHSLYKLVWVLQALGQQVLSDLGLCLYQSHQQYSLVGLPLPLALLDATRGLLHLLQKLQLDQGLSNKVAGGQAQQLMLSAVAAWPQKEFWSSLNISLTAVDDRALTSLTLKDLPVYLATSFSALLKAEQVWFDTNLAFARHSAQLQKELRLLEQGAAAVKLPALEGFCSCLLDVHTLLALDLETVEFPGKLLWLAHQHLIAMLDRAAAWLEPVHDVSVSEALSAWLFAADESLVVANKSASDSVMLLPALTLFLRQLGALLCRSVRIEVKTKTLPSPHLQKSLFGVLQELLRWMLLQAGSDIDARRKEHKPLAINLVLSICQTASHSFQVMLLDDSSPILPNEKLLRRLRKISTCEIGELLNEVTADQGRCFRFSLGA